ncbi:sigma-70 family RNA polymerase sigma factor [Phytomonospora endophytica]|uniref:RNA polymerase sigma-70 factor (ECF subfamily) n=1 Tax=Phytomonospora endophytica TaxID=714109 RepID=A0A841FFC8_9ACTN|nr:sigma-70 family RNA polymerase sigma factor [Phytomonospora endophytica]MBB6034544.1 RNA polymerase sigma-70 factor (ECF subfamily) [Phytomonospora endophytica]GIG70453.1 DNA-directed RNA polymerase sigma-70 factor [Phytomonospora endophytica]
MHEKEFLAARLDEQRGHLRAVAYRILGSLSEAEDALQETWLKASRAELGEIDNLPGWLTTVLGRVCLDMLRARKARRETPLDDEPAPLVRLVHRADPEEEALLADSVGLAMLVVLDTLSPAERIAFVLHDMFAVPFEEIAPIVDRGTATTQKLASRARRRVRGGDAGPDPDLARRRAAIAAFLAAARDGNFAALLEMLDPDAVFRADATAVTLGSRAELKGAAAVAEAFSGRAQGACAALLGTAAGMAAGVVVAPLGRMSMVLAVTFAGDRITAFDVIADPARLAGVTVAAG